MKKSLLVFGLVVGLVSNMFGNEPVRSRKSLVEVSTEVSVEDITLEVSDVILEEVQEVEEMFMPLLPSLVITEVELEEVQEVDSVTFSVL